MKKKTLTSEQLQWLTDNYPYKPNSEIMQRLDISRPVLFRLRGRMGLSKSAEYLKQSYVCRIAVMERAKAAMTAEQRKAFYAANAEKWKATRRRDLARLAFGLEQRTKFRLVRIPDSRARFLNKMKHFGYVRAPDTSTVLYRPQGVKPRPRSEANAPLYGIKIIQSTHNTQQQ